MANTAQIAALTAPDLHRVFLSVGAERAPEYMNWCNEGTMPYNPMTDREVAGLGVMQGKPEGSRFTLDTFKIGNTRAVTAVPYGMALEFTFEAWDDELYGIARDIVAQMGRTSRHQLEVEAAKLLNNATTGTAVRDQVFDGGALLSATHTGIDGVSRANRSSGAVGFSVTGIQDAIKRFHSLTNEANLPQLLSAGHFQIHAENLFAAREIFGSPQAIATANNEINSLVAEDFTYMINHFLTTSTYWFMMTNKSEHDLFLYHRNRPMFDAFDDPWTKNAVYTVYQRNVSAALAWRGIDGNPGA
jgi:hypothetical protein